MTHHPDCDEHMLHRVDVQRTKHGTYVPVCALGCELGIVGSAERAGTSGGSRATAGAPRGDSFGFCEACTVGGAEHTHEG